MGTSLDTPAQYDMPRVRNFNSSTHCTLYAPQQGKAYTNRVRPGPFNKKDIYLASILEAEEVVLGAEVRAGLARVFGEHNVWPGRGGGWEAVQRNHAMRDQGMLKHVEMCSKIEIESTDVHVEQTNWNNFMLKF